MRGDKNKDEDSEFSDSKKRKYTEDGRAKARERFSRDESGGGGRDPCTTPPPPGVPDNWVRPPGAPCDCDVFMAPDGLSARPPSPWQACGTGCEELVIDWTNEESSHLLLQTGVATAGDRYLAYGRMDGFGSAIEHQIVHLPSNEVVFNSIAQPPSKPFGNWSGGIRRSTPAGHLIEYFASTAENTFQHHSLTYIVPLEKDAYALPEATLNEIVDWGALFGSLSDELWAVGFQGGMGWGWHGIELSPGLNAGWSSPDGREVTELEALGSTIFFGTFGGAGPTELLTWNAADGAAPLITYPTKNDGGACCLSLGPTEMTWFECQGLQSGNQYATCNAMASPVATSPSSLVPRVLREGYQDHLVAGLGITSSSYDVRLEKSLAAATLPRVILTRLSDGHYWVVPPRPDRTWINVAYLDDEELALLEARVINGALGPTTTIVRLRVDSLGMPLPPGSGF